MDGSSTLFTRIDEDTDTVSENLLYQKIYIQTVEINAYCEANE